MASLKVKNQSIHDPAGGQSADQVLL